LLSPTSCNATVATNDFVMLPTRKRAPGRITCGGSSRAAPLARRQLCVPSSTRATTPLAPFTTSSSSSACKLGLPAPAGAGAATAAAGATSPTGITNKVLTLTMNMRSRHAVVISPVYTHRGAMRIPPPNQAVTASSDTHQTRSGCRRMIR
jgi:hypothetical protein